MDTMNGSLPNRFVQSVIRYLDETRRAFTTVLIGTITLAGIHGCDSLAQTYPTRPLTLVAPSTPGSAPDVLSRIVAMRLSEQLGQQVIVSNRPGAGTNIGSQAVAQAQPDGYTILLGSIANTLNPHIMRVNYRVEDFSPISSVAAAPDILVVHPSVNAATVADLIAQIRSNPGMPAGHAGLGTTPHLSLELFRRAANIEVTMVPFKGGGEAQQGILSGQVPFMFATTIGVLPRVRANQLRALAISSATRLSAAKDIPTLDESGLAGFDVVAWFGLFAPGGTPPEIIERLSRETRAALSSPDTRKRLIELGAEPLGSTPAEFAAYVNREYLRWQKFSRDTSLRAE